MILQISPRPISLVYLPLPKILPPPPPPPRHSDWLLHYHFLINPPFYPLSLPLAMLTNNFIAITLVEITVLCMRNGCRQTIHRSGLDIWVWIRIRAGIEDNAESALVAYGVESILSPLYSPIVKLSILTFPVSPLIATPIISFH